MSWSCLLVSSLCEVVLYSGEFFVWGGHVFWRVFFVWGGLLFWRVLCVRWSCILVKCLCAVASVSLGHDCPSSTTLVYSGELYV